MKWMTIALAGLSLIQVSNAGNEHGNGGDGRRGVTYEVVLQQRDTKSLYPLLGQALLTQEKRRDAGKVVCVNYSDEETRCSIEKANSIIAGTLADEISRILQSYGAHSIENASGILTVSSLRVVCESEWRCSFLLSEGRDAH